MGSTHYSLPVASYRLRSAYLGRAMRTSAFGECPPIRLIRRVDAVIALPPALHTHWSFDTSGEFSLDIGVGDLPGHRMRRPRARYCLPF